VTGSEHPDPGQLADNRDELGWDRDAHGRMADHAAPDDAVPTVAYEDPAEAGDAPQD
jgi:hypothetical protein